MASMLKLFPAQRCCSKIKDTFLIYKQVQQQKQQSLKTSNLSITESLAMQILVSCYQTISPQVVSPGGLPYLKKSNKACPFPKGSINLSGDPVSTKEFQELTSFTWEKQNIPVSYLRKCFLDWDSLATSLFKQKHQEIRNEPFGC